MIDYYYIYLFKADNSSEKESRRIPLCGCEVNYYCLLSSFLIIIFFSSFFLGGY